MAHHGELNDCRVLIVEDEFFLGDDLAKALRSRGALVVGPILRLADAMTVQHDGFDVAVIDINLHGSSAYPLADELIRSGKPFVFTTGYGSDAIPERFRHVQRQEKPYELETVVSEVAVLCSHKLRTVVRPNTPSLSRSVSS